MTDDQLARRYADPAFASARLLHLEQAGIVSRWRETLEDAQVFSPTRLTRLVARIAGLRPRRVRDAHLAHDIALVDLADYLVGTDGHLRFLAEDEVRAYLDSIAPSARRLRGDTRHRPDGLLLDGSLRIGIELEHTEKYYTRYIQTSGWFVREWRVDRVRWYVDRPRTLDRLRQVNEQHGFDRDMRIELEPFPPGVRVRERLGRFVK